MEDNKQSAVQDITSNITLDSIDDFLPLPGAESVVTADEDDEGTNSIFSKPKSADLGFLDTSTDDDDPDNPKAKITREDVDNALSELDEGLADDEDASKPGRKKIDKSGMVETFSKLIEEGVLIGFEDEKSLDDYSMKDWKELIQANLDEKERTLREQTPKEFFEALPEELQYAAEYVAKGGKDMKGLFRALSQVDEQR